MYSFNSAIFLLLLFFSKTMNSLRDKLSDIVADGAFGKNVDLVSFEQNTNNEKIIQLMSTVIFGTITTSDKSVYHIVIKSKIPDESKRELLKCDVQFHNELTMYEKIIPFLLLSCKSATPDVCNVPSLPRFFYGRNKCGEFAENDLIVLENLCPLGYRSCEERIFLDYDHLICALQALAKFHALSYTAKHRDPVRFREIVTDIRDTQLDPEACWLFQGDTLWKYGQRGVNRLLERSGDLYRDHEHLRRFIGLTGEGEHSIRRTLRPREPLSVVCHGDFNRNNLLFRYDDTGNPVDALLFDFGTPRYGSPALDLSFFLYMNTTQTTRRDRWDDLLNAYCATVAKSVPPGVRVLDRAELDSEMAASAFFGFSHASFFLPLLMSKGNPNDMEQEGIIRPMHFGGDAETERVADMVQHFVDRAYTNV